MNGGPPHPQPFWGPDAGYAPPPGLFPPRVMNQRSPFPMRPQRHQRPPFRFGNSKFQNMQLK